MAKKNIATFLGPNKGLSILAGHSYAFSGTYESVDGSQTMLDFTTGKEVHVGTFSFNAPVRFAGASAGGIAVYQISFNGVVVALGKSDSGAPDYVYQGTQEVIIPPLTHVTLKARCDENTANELITATFSGRVYDA